VRTDILLRRFYTTSMFNFHTSHSSSLPFTLRVKKQLYCTLFPVTVKGKKRRFYRLRHRMLPSTLPPAYRECTMCRPLHNRKIKAISPRKAELALDVFCLSYSSPSSSPFAPPCKGDYYYTLLPVTDKEKTWQNPCESAYRI